MNKIIADEKDTNNEIFYFQFILSTRIHRFY